MFQIPKPSPGKSAYENYKGHGVFTYALMEALHKGDTNGNGKIEVTELAAHIEKRVPELFAELKQNGWVVKGGLARRRPSAGARPGWRRTRRRPRISARRARISHLSRACLRLPPGHYNFSCKLGLMERFC